MSNENNKSTKTIKSEAKTTPKAQVNKKTTKEKAGSSNEFAQKRKYYKPKSQKNKSRKSGADKTSMVAPKKIKLLFTVVNRQKTEFFTDILQNFEVNMQLVLSAQGTASGDIISLLGLTDCDKSVIISVIRQDRIKDALAALEEKFNTVKGGKGIAYTVPIKSAIGVAIYRFLSNTAGGGLING